MSAGRALLASTKRLQDRRRRVQCHCGFARQRCGCGGVNSPLISASETGVLTWRMAYGVASRRAPRGPRRRPELAADLSVPGRAVSAW